MSGRSAGTGAPSTAGQGMAVMRKRLIMNGRNYRMTDDMRKVLAAVVDAVEPPWGFLICERTGLGSGVVYPVLERLMNAGVIRPEWESPHRILGHVGGSTIPCTTRRGTGRTGFYPRHLPDASKLGPPRQRPGRDRTAFGYRHTDGPR